MPLQRGPLLRHLDEIEARCESGQIRLQELVGILGRESHYVFILFLILPFLQPVPLIGLSTPFGLLIALVAVFAFFKKPAWVPKKWAQKKIDSRTVKRIAEFCERIFLKLSFILHPRWAPFFDGPFPVINTALTASAAVLLALPLPIPFSNAIPAWLILFQTLGQLERDGFFILLSYLQAALCIAYFFAIAEAVAKTFEWLV